MCETQKFAKVTQLISDRILYVSVCCIGDFSSGASGKESACQCRMCGEVGFDLWVWKIPWRRKWQPTPVFLPGKSQGQRSLEGYSPWGHKGSDTTAHTQHNILHRRCLFIFGNKEFNFFFFFFLPHCKACGILVPQPGIERGPWH